MNMKTKDLIKKIADFNEEATRECLEHENALFMSFVADKESGDTYVSVKGGVSDISTLLEGVAKDNGPLKVTILYAAVSICTNNPKAKEAFFRGLEEAEKGNKPDEEPTAQA